jgi:transposase
VELFEAIRREYEFGVGTIKGVASKLKVHPSSPQDRLVREALDGAVPAEQPPRVRAQPRVEPVRAFIDEILAADRQSPRKQRHTAHRIFTRLSEERPEQPIGESTVRRYVRARKAALGLLARETFVPQRYDWGSEAQVDWYEAYAELDHERVKLQVFSLRSMASGGAFHRAYWSATQQAFLEAHELAFAYFGGVFSQIRYDNLSAAVQRVLRGHQREETARFVGFRSHWRFAAEFCTPAEGHEKGGVESEVGRFRRNHWVPLPQAADLGALNQQLLAACQADELRTVAGRHQPVGTAMLFERTALLPLASEGADLAEISFPVVSKLGWVKVKTNAYSVPVPAGTTVQVKLSAASVEVWYQGRQVALHERCYARHQEILDLEHYLDVLEHKPGALAGSKPLAHWRQLGRWPASERVPPSRYDQFWAGLIARRGRQEGTREMIGVLQLGRQHPAAKLRGAVETALAQGCYDRAAVQLLLRADQLERPGCAPIAVGKLAAFERPTPTMEAYDQLLVGARR